MRKIFVFLSAITIILSSCKDNDSSSLLPNVSGKSGEVILVIEPDQWSTNVGLEFRKKLSQAYPALPQNEPIFDLIHIPYSAFSNIFKTHRNIVVAKVDKDIHEPKITVQKNIWAKPQIILTVIAPNDSLLESLIKEKGDLLVDKIIKKEMERYAKNYKKYQQLELADILQRKFGIRLTIPTGYTLDLDTTNFVWIESRGRSDAVQGILIYSYDKPDEELTTDFIFAKRNQFTKQFVAGKIENSYMKVESEAITYRREIKVNDINVIELRNLWKMENDFMGGPFVSFTIVDKPNNKIINIDGFVYAPQFDKRDYLRQLESILNSVQLPKHESAN